MANSIKPVALESGTLLRMDQGFYWSHDFQWRHLDADVDLSNWTISAEFWYRTGSGGFGAGFGAGFGNTTNQGLAIAASDVGFETVDAAAGKFELSVDGPVSNALEDNSAARLSLLITATNSVTALGHPPGKAALIATDRIPLYSNGNSAQSGSTGTASLVVIETGTSSASAAVNEQDTVVDLYDDLPNPTTVPAGVIFRVTNDPNYSGIHMVIGPAGSNGTHYQQLGI